MHWNYFLAVYPSAWHVCGLVCNVPAGGRRYSCCTVGKFELGRPTELSLWMLLCVFLLADFLSCCWETFIVNQFCLWRSEYFNLCEMNLFFLMKSTMWRHNFNLSKGFSVFYWLNDEMSDFNNLLLICHSKNIYFQSKQAFRKCSQLIQHISY